LEPFCEIFARSLYLIALGKSKPHPHFKKYRPQAKRKAAIAAWYSRFDSGAIWNDKAVSRSPPPFVSP